MGLEQHNYNLGPHYFLIMKLIFLLIAFAFQLSAFAASPILRQAWTTNAIPTNATAYGTTLAGATTIASATASRVAVYDGGSRLTNSPNVDLTELEYLNGILDYEPSSLRAFGDSVTSDATGYVSQLATAGNLTITNLAVSGTQLPDAGQMDRIYTNSVNTNTLSLLLAGYTDMRFGGSSAGVKLMFQHSLAGAILKLCIPDSKKFLGQSTNITYTGVWSDDVIWDGTIGKYTSVNGATATATNVYGRTIYVASVAYSTGGSGQITVSVDGVSYGIHTISGVYTATDAGRIYAPYIIRIPGLSVGPHTVVCTVTTAGTDVRVDFIAGSAGARSINGPYLYLGNTLRISATGYAIGAPFDQGTDTAVNEYNNIIAELVRDYSGDGLGVVLVDANSQIDPYNGDISGDDVHPSDQGESKLMRVFLEAIKQRSQPIDKQGGRVLGGYLPKIELGSGFARSGYVRLPSQGSIVWRNAAGTGDGPSLSSLSDDSAAVSSAFGIGGPLATPLQVGGTATLGTTNSTYLISSDAQTVTLPTAAGIKGRQYTVKQIVATSSTVTNATGAQTIDGALSYSLSAQWKYVTVQSDGTNWFVIANN